MKIGMNLISCFSIDVDLFVTGMICIVGGTGSGKSMAVYYLLYNLFKSYPKLVELSIADFKKSGDYLGMSKNYAEYDKVTELIENFYDDFLRTPENNPWLKILIIDEYAGYITWLMQNDRKKAEEIKGKISNILMLGRSRHCFCWCIQQRISASLFVAGIGAIDNYQICIGLGRLSVDSRKSLFANEHLEDEEFENSYHPETGQGLVLIDGQMLQPIQIPFIPDKEMMKKLLIKLAN